MSENKVIHCANEGEWDRVKRRLNVTAPRWGDIYSGLPSDCINMGGGGWYPKELYDEKNSYFISAQDFLREEEVDPYQINKLQTNNIKGEDKMDNNNDISQENIDKVFGKDTHTNGKLVEKYYTQDMQEQILMEEHHDVILKKCKEAEKADLEKD